MRTRTFATRRPDPAPPPVVVALGLGMSLGALAGLALGGFERAVLCAASVPVPGIGLAAVIWAGAGLIFGGLGASTGLMGAPWALASSFGLLGFVLSAELGTASAASGGPAWLGVLFGTGVGVGTGQLVSRSGLPAEIQQALATAAGLLASVLVPLHLHVLAGPTTAGAIGFSLLVAALVLAASGVAWAVTHANPAPWWPVLLALLVSATANLVFRSQDPEPARPRADTPPLLLVVIDGLRADRVGWLGYPRHTTPELDAFASTSLIYEGAHATSNWSVPSLASVLTGRLPYTHGAGLNGGRGGLDTPLRPDIATLAQELGALGVHTAAVAADPRLRTFALDTGFSEWHDDPGRGALPVALLPLSVAGLDAALGLRWPRRAEADAVVDRAIAAMKSWPERGWFLMVQLSDAGGPFTYTRSDLRAVGLTTRPEPADRYDAAVYRVDREVGRLLEAAPPNTFVVVLGSHGVSLGEQRRGWEAQQRYRSGHLMFEELVHVPLLVKGPGLAPRRIAATLSLVDVAPTLLRLAGGRVGKELEGEPLAEPFGLSRVERPVLAHSSLFGPEQQMVIVARHKMIRTATGRSPVYDLVGDPAETTPLQVGGAENDLRRRHLGALLPARSSLIRQPPLTWQLGQIIARFTHGRP